MLTYVYELFRVLLVHIFIAVAESIIVRPSLSSLNVYVGMSHSSLFALSALFYTPTYLHA